MIAPAILFINILIGFISMHLLGIVKKKKKWYLEIWGFFLSQLNPSRLSNYEITHSKLGR